jgi:hypothetical protein
VENREKVVIETDDLLAFIQRQKRLIICICFFGAATLALLIMLFWAHRHPGVYPSKRVFLYSFPKESGVDNSSQGLFELEGMELFTRFKVRETYVVVLYDRDSNRKIFVRISADHLSRLEANPLYKVEEGDEEIAVVQILGIVSIPA